MIIPDVNLLIYAVHRESPQHARASRWRVVSPVEPGDGHWRILRELLAESGAAGNLTMDAHLAALCIERGAVLHSADGDFARFRPLRWENPLA